MKLESMIFKQKVFTTIVFLQFFIIHQSFGKENEQKNNDTGLEIENPGDFVKNTSYISATTFMMKEEVSHNLWIDYLFSLQKMYGEKSVEFYSAIPDMTQLNFFIGGECNKKIHDSYFYDFSGAYGLLPIVNISQLQAENFADFYADRLYEWILYKSGKLKSVYNMKEGDFFTRERYLQGKDPNTIGEVFPFYLEGRLPSKEEFDAAKSTNLEYLNTLKSNCKNEKSRIKLSNKIESHLKTVHQLSCNDFLNFPFKDVGIDFNRKIPLFDYIRNLDGNVREWSSEHGKSLGAGYQDDPQESYNYISENGSQPWLGCRIVFEWKAYKAD